MKEYRLHGPPGTGKTRALADVWVPRAADKFGASNVVICSLTKTAAAEIASRDLPIPRDNVGTLHALAFRALGRPTIAEGEIKAWNEAQPLFRLSGGGPSVDNPELGRSERGTKGDELMALAQVYRHNRLPLSAWREDAAMFHRKWVAWMAEEGLVDFTGLIEDALDAVPVAPGEPSVFVVDEAQDCSVLELDLVRKWAARAEDGAVLSGDGDQAIYGWRGASARAFLDPAIPPENNYHLTQSYRVPVAVHAVASKWIEQASYRYAVEYQPRDYPGEVSAIDGNARNVMPLIAAAVKAADQGKSVMILASCGYMLRNVVTMLRREGIPFHNPYRPTHGGWNPLRGGAGRLLAYLRPDPETYPEDYRIWTWDEAARWVEVVKAKEAFAPAGKTMIRQQAKEEDRKDKGIEAGDGRACFGESWEALRAAFAAGAPIEWIEERLLASKKRLMEYPIAIAKKRGRKSLREDPRICVGTQHSVKGGQADVVILLPDLSPSGMREWTRPGDGRDGIIRTFYVGMTRARERLLMAGRWRASSIDWRSTN
jgi:DNA helicase-2/ATP-dependent DNA helicase PcrA